VVEYRGGVDGEASDDAAKGRERIRATVVARRGTGTEFGMAGLRGYGEDSPAGKRTLPDKSLTLEDAVPQ
jgi:hypothetical protein